MHDNSVKPKPKFAVGVMVRITKKQEVFRNGYLPSWTEELFIITNVQYANPTSYKIKDMKREEIKGTFYEQELQKSTQDTLRIETVVKAKGNKLLVK
jgi:hypothetical protein